MGLKENIYKYRIANNMTLEEVAKKLGVSKPTIQRYESGVISNIPSERVELLSKIFNVSPSELMGWNDIDLNDEKESISYIREMQVIHPKIFSCIGMILHDNKKILEKILKMYNFSDDNSSEVIEHNVATAIIIVRQSIFSDMLIKIFSDIKTNLYKHITDSWIYGDMLELKRFNSKEVNKLIENFSNYIYETIKEIIIDKLIVGIVEFINLSIDISNINTTEIKVLVEDNFKNSLMTELFTVIKQGLYQEIRLEIIYDNYYRLNETGQEKVLEYIEDLYESDRYKREKFGI